MFSKPCGSVASGVFLVAGEQSTTCDAEALVQHFLQKAAEKVNPGKTHDTCKDVALPEQTHLPGGEAHDMAVSGDGRGHDRFQGDRIDEAWQWILGIHVVSVISVSGTALPVAIRAAHS